jgi:hypothetical protein
MMPNRAPSTGAGDATAQPAGLEQTDDIELQEQP